MSDGEVYLLTKKIKKIKRRIFTKRKFSLLFNIATLVLCISAIAFGVYSAKQASLNVTGSIGFTAHNCKVKVDSSLSGFSETLDGKVVSTARTSTKIVEGTATLDLGIFYFTDLTASGNTNDITLMLTFTNQSDFAVDVTIEAKDLSGSNITVTLDTTSLTLAEQSAAEGKTGTAKVTLKCTSTTKIDSAKFEILSVSMSKHTEQQATGLKVTKSSVYWDSTSEVNKDRSYVTMGTIDGKAEGTKIKWYIFAQSDSNGNMQAVTNANPVVTNADNTLKAGTYWFISEYVLGTKKFGSSNTYKDSTIQTYLSGTEAGSFINTHGITAQDAVYSQITARTLEDAADAENQVGALTKVENQKLWLLSVSELKYLNNGTACSGGSGYTTLLAQDAISHTAFFWWLRSPIAEEDYGAFRVNDGGSVDVSLVDFTYGVRAAFQITIQA